MLFIWVTLVKSERIGDKNMKLNGHDRKKTVYLYSYKSPIYASEDQVEKNNKMIRLCDVL